MEQLNKENPNSKVKYFTFTDFIAGAVGGVASVIVGQPFDIVKVRQQTSHSNLNALTIIKNIWTKEGPLAFYKGTLSPLLGISFAVAIDFMGFEFGKKIICSIRKIKESEMTNLNIMLSGSIAGICFSFLMSPVELFRIKMQVQTSDSSKIYKSSVDAAISIFKQEGISGVYKGYTSTLCREVFGGMIYFGVYEILLHKSLEKRKNFNRDLVPIKDIVLFSSLSGTGYWFAVYPFDVVKSKIQASENKTLSFSKTFLSVYNTSGISGFYKGLVPCLIRAPFVTVVTFIGYEKTKVLIHTWNKRI